MTKDIYSPAVGENIQIGQQTNTFSISISEDLLASLRMSRVSFRLVLLYSGFHSITMTPVRGQRDRLRERPSCCPRDVDNPDTRVRLVTSTHC
jgi:hypothetical protein